MTLIVEASFSEQSGLLAVETLLARGMVFTAIVAGNDQIAYGARLALFRHGIRVPEDLLIVCQRTQGNTLEYPFPMIFLESDPRLYTYRMAEGFLRLYRGETLPNNTITVPRTLITDAMRNDPRAPSQVWQRA